LLLVLKIQKEQKTHKLVNNSGWKSRTGGVNKILKNKMQNYVIDVCWDCNKLPWKVTTDWVSESYL